MAEKIKENGNGKQILIIFAKILTKYIYLL